MKKFTILLILITFIKAKSQINASLQFVHSKNNCELNVERIYKNNTNKSFQLDNKGQLQIEKYSQSEGKYVKMIRPNKIVDVFDSEPIFSFWEVRNFEFLDFKKDSLKIINYITKKIPNLTDSISSELCKKFFLDINRPLLLKPNEKQIIRDNISIYLNEKGRYRLKLVYRKYLYDYAFSNQLITDLGIKSKFIVTPFYNPKENKTKIAIDNYIYIEIE